MHLTVAALTVYFVGLIHFEGRDVILPNASKSVIYEGVELAPHDASVVITGTNTTVCGSFREGTLSDHDTRCTIPIREKTIRLPSSSVSYAEEGDFGLLPKVQELCPGATFDVGYKTEPKKHAAVLTIDSGKLNACTDGSAWVAYLTLDSPTGKLAIGNEEVDLNAGAVVWITSEPAPGADDKTPEKHFWWHYVMYPASHCTALPETTTEGHPSCGIDIPTHHHGAASGAFCSPTH